MTVPEPTMRIEATRFTVTPHIDVVDLHNVQVHVEQQRDGRWIAGDGGGMWYDPTGRELFHCREHYDVCATDFASAMRIGVEAAQRITERWNGRG